MRRGWEGASSLTAKPNPPCTEGELLQLYARLRREYFTTPEGDSPLPSPEAVRVEWSHRVTASAGLCYPAKRIIRLSTHYHARFPEDVEATLLHEMIHLIVPGHGPLFYRWMESIRARGGRVYRYSKERAIPASRTKWLYTCRSCGRSYGYARRLAYGGVRHYCRRCGPDAGRLAESRS